MEGLKDLSASPTPYSFLLAVTEWDVTELPVTEWEVTELTVTEWDVTKLPVTENKLRNCFSKLK